MRLVVLTGKARSGKDTVAEFIRKIIGSKLDVQVVGFADAVKEAAFRTGWDGTKNTNGRSLLQFIGMRQRQENQDFWVYKLSDRIRARDTLDKLWVVVDCRFLNEASWARFAGGKLVRILRPNFDNGLTDVQKQHPSETEMDSCVVDWTVFNEGSLEELEDKIRIMLERFFPTVML